MPESQQTQNIPQEPPRSNWQGMVPERPITAQPTDFGELDQADGAEQLNTPQIVRSSN